MVDDIIGSLGIQIEADASDLPGQYDAAVAASEEAAGRIAQAFESLVGVGEALAITEGLKEFGQEALNAYGTVQSVTIGLTQLTKSASEANDIIEQIKTLAATEPFAFPDIAPTVQKMVALGVSAEQIPAVMQAVGDSSAATGNSFDGVANSLDRMALSGTVSSRSLVQLGISTADLGRVMGVSADEVKTAFAALDQSERIDILTQALDKFAGAAKAQADGIAGQWQIFQNKFEEVMVSVGQAVAPAVSDILKFGSEVLQVAHGVVDAFNTLPGPIKEVAGGIALAVAAIAPLSVAAGTLGLGLIGIRAAIEPLNDVLIALGLRSGEAAVAQEAEAVAAGHLAVAEGEAAVATATAGESASTAIFGFAALDTAVLSAGAALVGLGEFKAAEWADQNIPAFHAMTEALYDLGQKAIDAAVGVKGTSEVFTLWVTGALKPGAAAADQLSQSTFLLSQKLGDLGVVIPRGSMSMQEWNAALLQAAAGQQKAQDGLAGYGSGLDVVIAKQEKLNASEQQAAANLIQAKLAYADGAIGIDVLTAAQDEYTKAVSAAQSKSSEFKDTLGGLTEAYDKQQGTINTLQNTIAQLLAVTDRTQEQDTILAEATNKLTGLLKQQADAHGLVTAAVQGQGKAYDNLATSADAFMAKEIAVGVSVQQAKAVLDQLTASTDTSAQHQRAVIDAMQQYSKSLVDAGQDTNGFINITVNGVKTLVNLQQAIKDARDHAADFTAAMVTVPQVVDTATGRLNGMIVPLGFVATGIDSVVTVINNRAIPAYKSFADSHTQLATDAGGAQAALAKMNAETAAAIDRAASATNGNSSLANAIVHVTDATSDEISVNNAWNDSIFTSVDNASKFANSINGVTAALHNMATAEDEVGTAAFDAGKGLEGMNGQTANALQYVAGVLALSKSPATAGMVSESAIEASEQALHKMGYEGNAQAGFVFSQQLYDAMNGVTEASTKTSAALTTTATASTSVASSTTAASSSLGSLSSTIRDLNASATQTSSTTDGLTTSFTTANQAVDFAGMTGTQLGSAIGKLGTELLSAGVVVDGAGLSAVDYATKLQSTVDGMNASSAAVQQMSQASQSAAVGIATAAAVVEAAGAMVSGVTNTGPSQQMQDALTNMTSLATPGTTDLGSKIPNILATFNGQVITGSPGMSLSSALATQDLGIGSGSSSTGPMPLYTGAPQPTAQPITVNMNYPVFSSQGQSQQTMKDLVSQIRTVTGIKQ